LFVSFGNAKKYVASGGCKSLVQQIYGILNVLKNIIQHDGVGSREFQFHSIANCQVDVSWVQIGLVSLLVDAIVAAFPSIFSQPLVELTGTATDIKNVAPLVLKSQLKLSRRGSAVLPAEVKIRSDQSGLTDTFHDFSSPSTYHAAR
jgi:hypothetical protein